MNITGGESLSLFEAQEAADIVQDAADEDVNMIFGTVINPELQDELVVTVIATGFNDKPSNARKPQGGGAFGGTTEEPASKREEGESLGRKASFENKSTNESTDDSDIPSFIRNRR